MDSLKLTYIITGVVVILIGGFLYFSMNKNAVEAPKNIIATTTSPIPAPVPISSVYKNTEYGFTISLPKTWEGYSIIEEDWEGFTQSADGNEQNITATGPFVSVRHPDWEYKSPRQDIPVFVFSLDQWNRMQKDEFHIGASPINPTELGRNKRYVFALPARYNFAFLTGYEEVEEIIKSGAVKGI